MDLNPDADAVYLGMLPPFPHPTHTLRSLHQCAPAAAAAVQLVDFAPMAVRAEAFVALGGLEEGFALPGDCGIFGDWEFCARAWMAGLQVYRA